MPEVEQMWYSIDQVARRLGIDDRDTVRKMIARGEFPGAIKLGPSRSHPYRIPLSEIQDFERRSRVAATARSGRGRGSNS